MSEYRGGDSDGDSSGDDSVLIEREGFRDVVDEEVPPTVWDEVIVNHDAGASTKAQKSQCFFEGVKFLSLHAKKKV